MILAGDVGGTKTNLALAAHRDGRLRLSEVRSYPSQRYASLEAVVEAYLAETEVTVSRACFGVAGPVLDGQATITNLPWRIAEARLAAILGGSARVRLINDLTALASAVPALGPSDLVPVQEGPLDPTGPIGLVAPGTGLGVGYLCWDGERYRPGSSEGGHVDLAPADELQDRLLAHLRAEYGHVSWERVLSGPGLHAVYRFLRRGQAAEREEVAARLAAGDPSAAISALALAGEDEVCAQALHLFVSMLGAYAGNLALTLMATGGIYLGGGIAPKILPKLLDGAFVRAFRAKGRLAHVVERIPVQAISNEQAHLLGAASCALAL